MVVSVHGSDIAVSERSRVLGLITEWTFERAAAVTAPSRDLVERARLLGARERLEVVPYGAASDELVATPDAGEALREQLGIAANHVLVAGIGRLIPVKGFDYLLEALAKASRDDPRLRLVLVGDGSLRASLAARAEALGITEGVRFVGAVRHDQVPAYLAAADIVVVPSIRYGGYVDGLPNVALEAMAAGRALVATRVGGLPDLVDPDKTGVLVGERDTEALTRELLTLAGDPELRTRLGRAAQAEIRDHRSWHSVAERFVSVYETACGRR